ncbi:hypothetical protein DUI87_34191 [Hirundo rustica rustica]|uniref:Hydin adenylate kinase-like domain-containing protein n=1 Tax=Hirundo rustica rustica TaxID=333673 RepID=A0A3M0IIW5_HIRRU|nr:hypothetical protein DUI87_34191 [Hirundo rustica rustica]
MERLWQELATKEQALIAFTKSPFWGSEEMRRMVRIKGKTEIAEALCRCYDGACLSIDTVVKEAVANDGSQAGLCARELCTKAAMELKGKGEGPFLNMGPVTKVTVAVINFAIWVNEVRKSWIFNFLWKAGTWIQGYHTLTVCFWSYFNNGTYCEEMTPGEIFSQPFTQLFGPTPPVFEGFKSLNVNDIIQWLVLLVCLFCLAFRDKGRLTWITTLIPTLENKDAAPQPEPVPQPDPAPQPKPVPQPDPAPQPEPVPQPDTVPQPASGINHPDLVKEIGEMLREYLSPVVASLAPAAGKPSPCPDKGESDGAAAKPTDVTTVQVPAEPQGQPQPAAVAPVETKKYKVKSEHPGNKDKKGGPSQPGRSQRLRSSLSP